MSNFDGGSLADLLKNDEPLSEIARFYTKKAGRQLSADALKVYQFLAQNGSPDLAAAILEAKSFQASTKEVIKMVEQLSPAQVTKQQIEWQAAAAAKAGGS